MLGIRSHMFVSVIIPAKNEEAVIEKMIIMLLTLYDQYIGEIIVVNDNSTDLTKKIVKKLTSKYKKVKLINSHLPTGVGYALRQGLKCASPKANYIFTIDADFIRNVPDFDEFFSNIDKYDGLIGSRYLEKNSLINYPFLKMVFNRLYHLLINITFGLKRTDMTNNFKLYKKEIFDSLDLQASGFAINAETGLYPLLKGYTIGEIPVSWYARSRNMGQSKFKLIKLIPDYYKVFKHSFSLASTKITLFGKFLNRILK